MAKYAFNKQNVICIMATALLAVSAGCSKQGQQQPVKSQPAETPVIIQPPATKPAATKPTATKPAATQPASTYDSKPPYPVKLHVRSPDDKQPGWLKIVELADPDTPATADGTFPEQNRFYVDTQNVKQIRIHVSHLPLATRKRIILQIDKQGIEITRKKNRKFVILERRPTGEWVVVKTPK
ncbi:MAG: hypothetical protein JSV03_03545 [Planctomycetota bacterium]|nr:MAG: hypothetical protein JSV03_03545 [Planctomycetota bacterium]